MSLRRKIVGSLLKVDLYGYFIHSSLKAGVFFSLQNEFTFRWRTDRQTFFKNGDFSGLKFEYYKLVSASVRPHSAQLHKVCTNGTGLFRPCFSETWVLPTCKHEAWFCTLMQVATVNIFFFLLCSWMRNIWNGIRCSKSTELCFIPLLMLH